MMALMVQAVIPQWSINILTGITSVGTVQLIIFLLRRRAELKTMDVANIATERTSSEPLLKGWETISEQFKDTAREAVIRADNIEKRMDKEREEFTAGLESAHRENVRLRQEVAQLRTDLDIANRQVEQLQFQLRSH